MLDHCSISHKGGLILWSRSFTPEATQLASSASSPVNSLVRDALIAQGGRTADETYEKDGYAVRWSFINDLELIFVVAYQRILQLAYVEDLLQALKAAFVQLYRPFLTAFIASLHSTSNQVTRVTFDLRDTFKDWDRTFDALLRQIEGSSSARPRNNNLSARQAAFDSRSAAASSSEDVSLVPSQTEVTPMDEQDIAAKVHTLKNRLRGGGGARRGRVRGRDSAPSTDTETVTPKRNKNKKKARKWGDEPVSETDMDALDFSSDKHSQPMNGGADVSTLVNETSLGTRGADGMYEVKDWEFSGSGKALLDGVLGAKSSASTTTTGLGSLFARLTGSKTLTSEDLKPVLDAMKQHLMAKNVAMDIADKVCSGVGDSLVGKKVGGFQTTNALVRSALSTSLTQILTPKTSTDLLLSIRSKLSSPLPSSKQRLPYTITFVGVNGVGKSTNLSKVCFWLVQNKFRVLIAACDTFRSGAVEQLRVHVRNLSMLAGEGQASAVELFERGYGKDAAAIAKEAINYAKEKDFDVVLIDTAGRMQDNEPLMRALAKLVSVNNPDKIIFVGEALVGNEAVDQLTKFDRALKDFSSSSSSPGSGRGIDGMLVTKWDTVDDKVGAALSMTYVTGQPILFVGCGQTYTDLRQLRVGNVVQAILGD